MGPQKEKFPAQFAIGKRFVVPFPKPQFKDHKMKCRCGTDRKAKKKSFRDLNEKFKI